MLLELLAFTIDPVLKWYYLYTHRNGCAVSEGMNDMINRLFIVVIYSYNVYHEVRDPYNVHASHTYI